MVGYLDSSVVLRHILQGESAIRHVLDCDTVVSSELLEIECCRVFYRYRLDGDIDDTELIQALNRFNSLLLGISILTLSPAVKKRAKGPFPVTVKTLDALHLSSAAILDEEKKDETIIIFSHDVSMNRCARALGFSAPFSVE